MLPDEMLLLAEPSPDGLVAAVGQALARVAAGQGAVQHAGGRGKAAWGMLLLCLQRCQLQQQWPACPEHPLSRRT